MSRKQTIITNTLFSTAFLLLLIFALAARPTTTHIAKNGRLFSVVIPTNSSALPNLHIENYSDKAIAGLPNDNTLDTEILGADGNVFNRSHNAGFTPPPMAVAGIAEQKSDNQSLFPDEANPSFSFAPDNSGWGWLANDVKSTSARPTRYIDQFSQDNTIYKGGFLDDKNDLFSGHRLQQEFGIRGGSHLSGHEKILK